jgi:CheY-like chemotaxis protein
MNTDNTHEENSDIEAGVALDTYSVLLVDDDPNFRMIVEFNLKRLGYSVSAAGSGAEALRIAEQNRDIHLLITDVAMPGMDGVELARKILRIQPRMEVLYISGFPLRSIAGMGVATGSVHFLQKPFPAARLDERIKAILAGAYRPCLARVPALAQ